MSILGAPHGRKWFEFGRLQANALYRFTPEQPASDKLRPP